MGDMDPGFVGLSDLNWGHDSRRSDEEAQRVIGDAIFRLPTLGKDQVPLDDNCGICLQTFSDILNDDAPNEGGQELADGRWVQLDGVTRLEGCGHVFCRLDLIEWIKGAHGTCPACRHQFLEVPVTSEEDESVDDDYVPEDDIESDGFTDADDWDLEPDEMNLDQDLEAYVRSSGDEAHRLVHGTEEYGEGTDPGLSDSFGSDGLSDGEVLSSLSPDEGDTPGAVVFSGEVRADDAMGIGGTSSTQTK